MFMNKGPRFWIMVGVASIVGMVVVRLRPDSYAEHRERVVDLFHLPEDVEFAMFRSSYRKNGGEDIEATIQLTHEQYRAFAASLEDPLVWAFVPFAHGREQVDAMTEPGWSTWWDGHGAVIVDLDESPFGDQVRERERALRNEPTMAIRWVGWGHGHGTGAPEGHSVWEARAHKSFCWAWAEQNGKHAARPCNAYPPTSFSPIVSVRALLDQDHERLFVYIH